MKLFFYILRQLLVAFLVSAAGMVFIAMPGVAVGAVHKLGGAGMASVLKLVPLMVAVFVPYVLPVALLLALVSTYGRLSAQNEWTAIRMSGVNPYRMLMPAVTLAVLAGCGVYGLNAEILPRIKKAQKTIQLDELRQVLKNLARGKTDLSIKGFFLSSTYRDPDDHQTFYDCLVRVPVKGSPTPQTFYAKSVHFAFTETEMQVELRDSRGSQAGVVFDSIGSAKFVVSLDKLIENSEERDFSNARYLTSGDLLAAVDRIHFERISVYCALLAIGATPKASFYKRWENTEARLLYTWHQHWANGFTCLMFVLVGVSTGLLLRKGTQLSALAVSVGFAMTYWIASLRLGKQLARDGVLEPWVGAWGPLLFFSLVGVWLTHRALRE